MSLPPDPVAFMRRVYEAVNTRSFVFHEDLFHPEFEFRSALAATEGRVYRGAKGNEEWYRDLDDAFGCVRFDVEEVIEAGDLLVVLIRGHFSGRSSGVAFSQSFGQVWRFRDGRATRNDVYATHAEALEAAGVPAKR